MLWGCRLGSCRGHFGKAWWLVEETLGEARKWQISKGIAKGIAVGFCSLDSVRILENLVARGGDPRKGQEVADF